MNYAYLLKCSDETFYSGWTDNLDRRLRTHNDGIASKYTRTRLPVSLVYFEEFATKEEAMSREWHFKHMSREEKSKLAESVRIVKTVSVETMRKSDAWTIANKIDSRELMLRAGRGIFASVNWHEPVGIVCGKGNNAGDGCVVASELKKAGIDCTLILLSENFSGDGKYYYDICLKQGIPAVIFTPNIDPGKYKTLLDCIFGTGFRGEVKGLYKTAIEAINNSGAYIVSADINSGLNGDTGTGEPCVKSDLTVSIGEFKPGHFIGLANEVMKERINIDIGIEIRGEYIYLAIPQ
ncbi:MAG: NAD(P)H-hydrate epimerase [Lachnospiraceae bacterium]|jgi:hydroxyethylthiazole kinase-like uncharacterized protein yjeF